MFWIWCAACVVLLLRFIMIICVIASGPLNEIETSGSCVIEFLKSGGNLESPTLEIVDGDHKDLANRSAVKCTKSK